MKTNLGNLQIVHMESVGNLFLDARLLINRRQILIFTLNSTRLPIHIPNKMKQKLNKRHLTTKIMNLALPNNIGKYLKANQSTHWIGYGINRYDSIMAAFLLDRSLHNHSVSAIQLNHFSKHLFYLGCTNRPSNLALNNYPLARELYRRWLSHGRLIDLKSLNHEPLKLTAGLNGLAIPYLKPIGKITDSIVLQRLINHEISNVIMLYQLTQRPIYQTYIDSQLKSTNPQNSSINYSIPGATNNYLDDTLRWARLVDRRYRMNSSLIESFLPIYNVFKNLQGCKSNQINFRNHNLNWPYIRANGSLSDVWISFGRQFRNVNVDPAKARRNPPRFFKRSKRSGNWLINPRYRTRSEPSQYGINLEFLHRLFQISLNYSKISSRLLWQLILWRTGESLILRGARIQSISSNQLRLSDVPIKRLFTILKRSLGWVLNSTPVRFHFRDLIQVHLRLSTRSLIYRLRSERQLLLDPRRYVKALETFQVITHVDRWSHRDLFVKSGDRIHSLGVVTRIFLVKPTSKPLNLYVAKVIRAEWYRYNNDPDYHSQLIDQVEYGDPDGKISSYRNIEPNQNVWVNQHALHDFTAKEIRYLYHNLDLKAYVKLYKSIEP